MPLCKFCGLLTSSRSHARDRQQAAKQRINQLKAAGYAPIPARRWTRAFRSVGVQVVRAPITINRTGNWVERDFLDGFVAWRRDKRFRDLPFKLQVEGFSWWFTRGRLRQVAVQSP